MQVITDKKLVMDSCRYRYINWSDFHIWRYHVV